METRSTELEWSANVELEDGECCIVFRNDGSEDLIRQYDIKGGNAESYNKLRLAFCAWALNNPQTWELFAQHHFGGGVN